MLNEQEIQELIDNDIAQRDNLLAQVNVLIGRIAAYGFVLRRPAPPPLSFRAAIDGEEPHERPVNSHPLGMT